MSFSSTYSLVLLFLYERNLIGADRDEDVLHNEVTLRKRGLYTSNLVGTSRHHFPLDPEKPMPLPKHLSDKFSNFQFLHAGRFGEVWKAEDIKNDHRPVALKMFFGEEMVDGTVRRVPLTGASAHGNLAVRERLRYARQECNLAQSLQMYKNEDPVGASRLMQCYEDHTLEAQDEASLLDIYTSPKRDLRGRGQLYQVLEYCGNTNLAEWMRNHEALARTSPKIYLAKALSIFIQILSVLHYMTHFRKRWCHHDIKPENIMVLTQSNGRDLVKIIDFGSMSSFSIQNYGGHAVSSPAYAEPYYFDDVPKMLLKGENWLRGYSRKNPSSYDVYSAGMILDELITGVSTFEKYERMAEEESNRLPAYTQEMCERQRLYSLLESSASDKFLYLKDAVADVKDKYLANEKKLCREFLHILNIKGESGVERRLTMDWGIPIVDKGHSDVELEKLLFHTKVRDAYSDVAQEYQKLARASNWYTILKKMMALNPIVRPQPGVILDTRFSRAISELQDQSSKRQGKLHQDLLPPPAESTSLLSGGEVEMNPYASFDAYPDLTFTSIS